MLLLNVQLRSQTKWTVCMSCTATMLSYPGTSLHWSTWINNRNFGTYYLLIELWHAHAAPSAGDSSDMHWNTKWLVSIYYHDCTTRIVHSIGQSVQTMNNKHCQLFAHSAPKTKIFAQGSKIYPNLCRFCALTYNAPLWVAIWGTKRHDILIKHSLLSILI